MKNAVVYENIAQKYYDLSLLQIEQSMSAETVFAKFQEMIATHELPLVIRRSLRANENQSEPSPRISVAADGSAMLDRSHARLCHSLDRSAHHFRTIACTDERGYETPQYALHRLTHDLKYYLIRDAERLGEKLVETANAPCSQYRHTSFDNFSASPDYCLSREHAEKFNLALDEYHFRLETDSEALESTLAFYVKHKELVGGLPRVLALRMAWKELKPLRVEMLDEPIVFLWIEQLSCDLMTLDMSVMEQRLGTFEKLRNHMRDWIYADGLAKGLVSFQEAADQQAQDRLAGKRKRAYAQETDDSADE